MKRLVSLFSATILSALALSACSSSTSNNNTTPPPPTIPLGMSATINGVTKVTDKAVVTDDGNGNIRLLGTDTGATGYNLFLDLRHITQPGVYSLAYKTDLDSATASWFVGTLRYYDPYKGSLHLTVINDSNYQGTFEFSANDDTPIPPKPAKIDTAYITNGQFNIKYIK